MSENDISIFTEIEGRMRSFETDDVFGMPDSPIEHVYLVQSGVVSLMVQLRSGDQIETGMVGPGGLIGACVLGRAPWSNVFVAQSPVCAWEMRTEDFIAAVKRDPKLHDLAFRHVQWLMPPQARVGPPGRNRACRLSKQRRSTSAPVVLK